MSSNEVTADAGGWLSSDRRRLIALLLVGLVLVALGTLLATWVTTAGGEITLEETTIETDSGLELDTTVYKPPDVSAEEPAPTVTLIHGYTGERGTMASFAQEFADRGYVVITIDQPGHGSSDPPAFEDNWGGSATLEYAHTRDIVDNDRIAMVGHSMGGFASLAAAKDHPEGYESLVLVGSTWGDDADYDDVPVANETFPRNLALLFTPYDEFSLTMYGESIPGNVPGSEKVRSVFGVTEPVEAGQIYGSVEDGTARMFAAPSALHTGMHRSTGTISETIQWVEYTIGGAPDRTSVDTSQHWYWTTAGHVISLFGALLIAISVSALVWRRLADAEPGITSSASGTAEFNSPAGPSRRLLIALSALPAVTFYPLFALGTLATPATRLTSQELTHGYLLWAMVTALLGAGIVYRASANLSLSTDAIIPEHTVVKRAFIAATAGAATIYLLVIAVHLLPGGGLRAWMISVGVLTTVRWFSLVVYILPIAISTILLAYGLDRFLDSSTHFGGMLTRGLALTCGGLVVFLAIQYIPLFAGYGLPIAALGPLTTQVIRSTFMVIVATILIVGLNRYTKEPLVGGLVSAFVIIWIIVSTSPLHVAPF